MKKLFISTRTGDSPLSFCMSFSAVGALLYVSPASPQGISMLSELQGLEH